MKKGDIVPLIKSQFLDDYFCPHCGTSHSDIYAMGSATNYYFHCGLIVIGISSKRGIVHRVCGWYQQGNLQQASTENYADMDVEAMRQHVKCLLEITK